MSKLWPNADTAVADIASGATLMLGGFGLCGIPETLILALLRTGATDLHTISNNMGVDGAGMGLLLEQDRIASHIGSYVGENRLLERRVLEGSLRLSLVPQGTLAERIRAGGAGIPAFYTPTGAGTLAAEGKEIRLFNDRPHVLETGLTADFALVHAWRADRFGNLQFRRTARNFNPVMATAARCTIAEFEEFSDSPIDPDEIHTPGIYVHRLVHCVECNKRIERRTIRTQGRSGQACRG